MLTPSSHDPNRKAELQRKTRHPHTFRPYSGNNVPSDWSSTGLVALDGKSLHTDPRKPTKDKGDK